MNRRPVWSSQSCSTAIFGVLVLAAAQGEITVNEGPTKDRSVFLPAALVERAQANAASYTWAAEMQRALVQGARPWLELSDDELWAAMFGPHITRSWMVWSDGYCPACRNDVRMYTWKIDPWQHPWKVECPHCGQRFPTNDFAAFHASGLDQQGVFQPALADRSLLFNADHPDPSDPLHRFGVDDGEGYVADGHRWRFIGCYLIYGHWKRFVHAGIVQLSAAYAATGDARYAYKAAILLDRVADVFPTFDFGRQGLVYETREGSRGQVSTWHDACEEVRELALAYDRIFAGARDSEPALVRFLSQKAAEHGLENPKRAWADIQRNIEQRIFVDTLAHEDRIRSNYPRTDVALLVLRTVLSWPHNRDAVLATLDDIVERATAVDGLSGEKGLAGYSAIAPHAVAEVLSLFSRLEPGFLETVYRRRPVLHAMYRFHVDTHCLDRFYPQSGDSGSYGKSYPRYVGLPLSKSPGVAPSMYSFLWDLYTVTGDPAFAQLLLRENGGTTDGLPYDLFGEDPAAFQQRVQAAIDKTGTDIQCGSVDKQQWCLAVLRSGRGDHRRAVWLDYDVAGGHRHADGMNLGLFAKGFDLVPDFGYPPVGYGGWGAPKAVWYTMSAAHVTVVVDGNNHGEGRGRTTLWADGERFRAIRAACPELIGGTQFERSVYMVDTDDRDSYILDCFRVEGGTDHAYFFHSFFGELRTEGLHLVEAEPYGRGTEMRAFRCDAAPAPGWHADWRIEDAYGENPRGTEVHLRYTGLVADATVCTAEAWVEKVQFGGEPAYIPRLLVRRQSASAPLRSVFVGLVEPYEEQPLIASAWRLALQTADGAPAGDRAVCVEVTRRDGRRDVIVDVDSTIAAPLVEPENDIEFEGQAAYVSLGTAGVERLALCGTAKCRIGALEVVPGPDAAFVELVLSQAGAAVVAGATQSGTVVRIDGQRVPVRSGR